VNYFLFFYLDIRWVVFSGVDRGTHILSANKTWPLLLEDCGGCYIVVLDNVFLGTSLVYGLYNVSTFILEDIQVSVVLLVITRILTPNRFFLGKRVCIDFSRYVLS